MLKKIIKLDSLTKFLNGVAIVCIITFGLFFALYLTDRNGLTLVEIYKPEKSIFPTAFIAYVYMHLFDGFEVGVDSIPAMLLTAICALLFTDTSAIVLLYIYKRVWYGFAGFALALLIQLLMLMVWSIITKFLYFSVHKPVETLIITDGLNHVKEIEKIKGQKRFYKVNHILSMNDPCIFETIDKCHTVFMLIPNPDARDSIVSYCFGKNKIVSILPAAYDIAVKNSRLMTIDDLPLLKCHPPRLTLEQRFVKRLMDLAIIVVGFIPAAIVMLIVAAAVLIIDGSPVIYSQERITYRGKRFMLYKFRTMVTNAEENGPVLSRKNDKRVTKLGAFLRFTRLDELPQLYNVLVGDMSIIGPRPEREELIRQYVEETPEFAYRLNVKAGLTGLAQVSGKYNTSPRDKLNFDLLYIRNYSLMQEIKILFSTIKGFSMKGFNDEDIQD